MEELNQFAISKNLGSKIKKMGTVRFGHLNLRGTWEEIEKALVENEPQTPSIYQQSLNRFQIIDFLGKCRFIYRPQ